MKFEEPKVEVVEIDPNETIVASNGQGNGGGIYCIGSQEDAETCSDWYSQTPW